MLAKGGRVVPTLWSRCVRARYGASTDLEGYRTLKGATEVFELEVKKSRFVARAWSIQDSSEAVQLLKEHSDPKASHNCYAYKMDYESKYSDDGEPSGTGGRPIFGAIEGEDLDRVCVLVTRYFGGVKLGAGPLGRAYGDAARQCLQSGEIVEIRPTVRHPKWVDAEVRLKYHSVFKLNGILRQFNGKILSKIPTHSGLCVVTFRIEEQYFEDFNSYVRQATSGIAIPRITNKTKLY